MSGFSLRNSSQPASKTVDNISSVKATHMYVYDSYIPGRVKGSGVTIAVMDLLLERPLPLPVRLPLSLRLPRPPI